MTGRRSARPSNVRAGTYLIALVSLIVLVAIPSASAAGETVTAAKSKTVQAAAKPTAAAAKKGGKKTKVTTRSTQVALASGTSATATATCPGKTHATGGGWAVSPSYTPNSAGPTGTGLRSMTVTSFPVGGGQWNALGTAFANPVASGAFTTFARCEGNALGRIVLRPSASAIVPPGQGQTFVFNCPTGTHAISGGYAGDPPTLAGADNPQTHNSWKIVVLQSYRTGPGQWTITAYNRSNASLPANTNALLTGYAVCEKNGKRKGVSEASGFAAIGENARTAADASCTGKKHVVSGGFSILPATFPGSVPVIGIDESQPVDKQGWHVGLHESQFSGLPLGSSLATYAYCKKDPRKKKRK